MTTGASLFGVANSRGVFAEAESTIVDASTVVMSPTSSGWAQASGWKLGSVNWDQLADEAIRKTKLGENPRDGVPGEYTVILDPYATSDLLGMMAADGMSALAFQEERSWLNGRIGEKVLSPQITIVDDGQDTAGIPLPFDSEGQPKQRVTIVDAGVCRGPVFDSYTAGRQAGAVSTGHAMEQSAAERVGPLPMNLFLRPGTSNVEEMIASTKERPLHHAILVYAACSPPRRRRYGNDPRWDLRCSGRRDCRRREIHAVHAVVSRGAGGHDCPLGSTCKTLWAGGAY